MTDCATMRERLAEHALGVLISPARRELDEHLAWCAACRKEAGQLSSAAAAVGLASQADPPEGLEERVVAAVSRASAPPGRRVARIAAVGAVAAAAAALGLAGAMAGRLERLEREAASARDRAEAVAASFEAVLEDVGGSPVLSAPLVPNGGGDAGGRGLAFDSREGRDFAVVIVGGLAAEGGPYSAYVVSPGERRATIGRLWELSDGQLSRYRFFRDLSGYREVVVVDAAGRTVLTGRFGAEPA